MMPCLRAHYQPARSLTWNIESAKLSHSGIRYAFAVQVVLQCRRNNAPASIMDPLPRQTRQDLENVANHTQVVGPLQSHKSFPRCIAF